MSFRKEKKYRMSPSELAKIQNKLMMIGMKELYPSRVINSCYFDTANLTLCHESEEGIIPRKKVRFRWYSNDMKFTKETKISATEGRYKYAEKTENLNSLKDIFDINCFDQTYGNLSPSIIVSYERQYFTLRSLRITFDRNISYSHPNSETKIFHEDSECVMEVKVPINFDDDYVESIVPYPTSRFSKYSRGIFFLKKLI